MPSPIPIQNVYYLLAYAWNRLPESEVTDVSGIDSSELVDLFAAVLSNGIRHLVRLGLAQTYITRDEEIAGVRGRIDVGVTARRMLISHGRTHCEFDELQVDTLPNQILRATVRVLLSAPNLNSELRDRLRSVDRDLGGITVISLSKRHFRRIQLHGNNRYYRFLLSVCELVLDMNLVDEAKGEYSFRDFIRDDKAMARLFESFIYNFYRIERADLDIRKEQIKWQARSVSDPGLRFLPKMETDISIRNKPHTTTLIVDAKFYRETFQSYYDREKVHSSHLYQIVSYLANLESRLGPDAVAAGMLVYPTIEKTARLQYELEKHSVEIHTLNLAADWREIREELLSFVRF